MVHVTDVLAVSMMLGITAQVKEAGVAWDKGEKKSKACVGREHPGPRREGCSPSACEGAAGSCFCPRTRLAF